MCVLLCVLLACNQNDYFTSINISFIIVNRKMNKMITFFRRTKPWSFLRY
nr:MAG TPA: hypothetical protein [Caudoviricetes sp.]